MQTLALVILIFDFSTKSDLSTWNIVNDVVMGGRSNSKIELTESGHAKFSGHVTLENNGGFASVRYAFDKKNIEGKKYAMIRCKGDGKRYQFRIKSKSSDYYSYISYFETGTDWEIVKIPLKKMEPTFRGRSLDMPNYNAKEMEEISILIANGSEQDFEILIDKIWVE